MDSKKKRRLSGEDDKENVESPLKKCRFSFASKEQIEAASVGVLSPNTDQSNQLAPSAFGAWRFKKNKHFRREEQCPESLLADGDIEALSYWLSRFVLEVRKGDGTEYPPKSLSHQRDAITFSPSNSINILFGQYYSIYKMYMQLSLKPHSMMYMSYVQLKLVTRLA